MKSGARKRIKAPRLRVIVVPLDGSRFAEHALPQAVQIARATGATIRLVRVLPPLVGAPGVPIDAAAMHVMPPALPVSTLRPNRSDRAAVQAYLERTAQALAARTGVTVRTTFLQGAVVPALARQVSARRASLVVMSTHGAGGLSRLWLGSVADGLIRRATVPILLIKPAKSARPTARRFRRVVVPLDGSPLAERIIAPAVAITRKDAPTFNLVRITEPRIALASASLAAVSGMVDPFVADRAVDAEAYLKVMAARVRATGLRVRARTVLHTRVAKAILDAAGDTSADLIAMATRGSGGVRRLLLGSVTDKVIRGATARLLILRVASD